jgi:phage terminase small subunit
MRELNPQQVSFCEYYIKGHSGTQAYMLAYSTPDTSIEYSCASASSSRLRKNPAVIEYIAKRRAEDQESVKFDRQDAINFLVSQVAEAKTATFEGRDNATDCVKIAVNAVQIIGKWQGWEAPDVHQHMVKKMSEEELEEGLKRVGFGRRSNQLADKENPS